jgi:hypothetical protein
VAPLNACGVQADAGLQPATCGRVGRAAQLRSSGRRERTRRVREESALRPRRNRETAATASRSHRCHAACKAHAAQQRSRCAARSGTHRASYRGHPWPSPFSCALRSNTLGILPRDCVHPLRACTKPCPAGAQRARWSCAPCTPAAPLNACRPHPRIAREVCALLNLHRARSRGYRRPCDITRDYAAHLLCVQARHAPSMAHEIPRPRNPSLCHMAASASLRSARLPRIHARHCWRPARAARVCAPSLACCSVAACGGCARGQRCGSGRSVAARSRHIAAPRVRPLNRCAVQADREPGAASVRRLEARSQSGKAVSRERARSNSQSKSSQREVP